MYLVQNGNNHRDGNPLTYPGESLRVHFARKYKADHVNRAIPGMPFQVSKDAGPDKRALYVGARVAEGQYAPQAAYVAAEQRDVDRHVREVREADRDAIREADERVAAAQAALLAAESERRATLARAFMLGKRVPLRQLREEAEAHA